MINTTNSKNLHLILKNTFKIPGISQKFSNQSFKNLVEKNLNIYRYISKTNPDECEELKKMYNELGVSFEFDVNFKYNVSDIEDDINYIKIFIKNIFNIDIENFDPSKTVVTPISQIANSTAQIPIPTPVAENTIASDIQKNAFFLAPAQIRLQNEIRQGKVFAFDRKPTSIPIIKTIAGVLLIIAGFSSFILSIFMLICNGADTTIKHPTSGETIKYNSTWSAMLDFLMGLIYIFASFNMLKPIYSKKNINENKKYFLAWQPIIFVGLFICISMVMEIFPISTELTIFEMISRMSEAQTNAGIKYAIDALYILTILSYVYILFIGIVITLAIVFNPKYDTKKLDLLIKQYIDEMITGVKT